MSGLHITLCLSLLLLFKSSFGQGRIVINEFMAWSGCSTTSEFIELLNFGPGPMDIGCYIVTNGKYSVTIPPNTIVQPGQYFVLSGQDVLPKSCGNTDSAVHVNLNWTTCNCTNIPVPVSGDGFMQDGGNANEKIILMDPNLNVIDAASRKIPVSSSVPITTPALTGGCGSKTFDLTNMNVSYENIGNSTGIDNSFARRVDGDCGWVKTTAISANAPNKTGSSSSATYNFNTVSASDCNSSGGSISIQVGAPDVNALFPMNYTLAFDADGNNTFEATDQYTYGVDNTAPSIDINNLAYGHYRVTVGSSSSCNLKSYDFNVFNCYVVVLPVKLLYFGYEGVVNDRHLFKYKVDDASTLNNVVLEGNDGTGYRPAASIFGRFDKNELQIAAGVSSFHTYRLRLTNQSGVVSYSSEIVTGAGDPDVKLWPNPVQDKLFIRTVVHKEGKFLYSVLNTAGAVVRSGHFDTEPGEQVIMIPVNDISAGMYYLKFTGSGLQENLSLRFLKQ
jgi:hypothetical protein